MIPTSLVKSYRATTYVASTPAGELRLRVGEVDARFDKLLEETGVACWAFVSAANPRSVRLDDAENTERHVTLRAAVRAAGWRCFEGSGVGDDAEWPAEASLLVLGMSEAEAAALGRRFGQHAVLVGKAGRPARLLACDAAIG